MKTLLLKRLGYDNKGTYGCIMEDSKPICLTLEDAWKGNAKGISCIPMGIYQVKRYSSEKHPDSWELQNVPDRTSILIHVGNTEADTSGCILLGSEWDFDNSAVLESKKAYAKFQEHMKNEDAFTLIVAWC